jgi:hypothetical protein
MNGSALGRKVRVVIAVAVFCVGSAGCAADPGSTKSERAEGNPQMRYYGGPKSPMWSGQQL